MVSSTRPAPARWRARSRSVPRLPSRIAPLAVAGARDHDALVRLPQFPAALDGRPRCRAPRRLALCASAPRLPPTPPRVPLPEGPAARAGRCCCRRARRSGCSGCSMLPRRRRDRPRRAPWSARTRPRGRAHEPRDLRVVRPGDARTSPGASARRRLPPHGPCTRAAASVATAQIYARRHVCRTRDRSPCSRMWRPEGVHWASGGAGQRAHARGERSEQQVTLRVNGRAGPASCTASAGPRPVHEPPARARQQGDGHGRGGSELGVRRDRSPQPSTPQQALDTAARGLSQRAAQAMARSSAAATPIHVRRLNPEGEGQERTDRPARTRAHRFRALPVWSRRRNSADEKCRAARRRAIAPPRGHACPGSTIGSGPDRPAGRDGKAMSVVTTAMMTSMAKPPAR